MGLGGIGGIGGTSSVYGTRPTGYSPTQWHVDNGPNGGPASGSMQTLRDLTPEQQQALIGLARQEDPNYQPPDLTPVPIVQGGNNLTILPDGGGQLVKNLKENGLSALTGGGGPALPPPGPGPDASMFGWGNFSPDALGQADYYNKRGGAYANEAAPQLQRTSVDWSGMGSGQQPAPAQPAAPQPVPQAANYGVSGGPTSMMDAQRQLIGTTSPMQTAPTTPGAGTAGGPSSLDSRAGSIMTGTAPAGTYSSAPATGTMSNAAMRQGQLQGQMQQGLIASTAQPQSYATPPPPGMMGTMGATPTMSTRTPANYAPSPTAPAPPQSAPSVPSQGQFSNPLFGQSQQTRNAEGGLMQNLQSPGMYATPMQGQAQQGRSAEVGALQDAANPSMFQTPQGADAAASRNLQVGTMAATTAPGMYNTRDYQQQEQGRAGQQGLVNTLQSDMTGNQPSLAELQLRRGADANVANANALAASAGPGGAAMARRQAMATSAKQGQALAADTADLRAKEYAQARQELGTATNNLRQSDIQNQGQSYQNITSTADRAAQQAQAIRVADLQNAGMSYDNAIKQAQLEQTGAQNLRAGDLQALGMEYSNTNQNADRQVQLAVQSRAQDLTALGMSYDNAYKQAMLEADQNKTQAQLDSQQRALGLQGELGMYGLGLGVQGQDLASRMHLQDLDAQKYAADRNLAQQQSQYDTSRTDKYVAMGLTGAGLILSDQTKKENIREADEEDMSAMLGELSPSMFGYKEPEKFGEGDHLGIMVQDLEKSRLGKLLVVPTPHGKAIDAKKAIGALFATSASTEKRLRKLEAER